MRIASSTSSSPRRPALSRASRELLVSLHYIIFQHFLNLISMVQYDQLLNYAFRILSKKRYTVFEMREKCRLYLQRRPREDELGNGWRVNDGLVDKVIARLLELKYLDDELFVRDYVRGRFKLKPCGKFLITRQLKLKGIPGDLVAAAVDEVCADLNLDELKLALEVLNKRRQRWLGTTILKQKSRAANLLISRGFSSNIVYKAISSCYNGRESGI